MTHSLEGKTALVTAAGAGIGRASAEALAALGASVVATDIDGAAVETLATSSERITGAQLDVLNADAVKALVASLPKELQEALGVGRRRARLFLANMKFLLEYDEDIGGANQDNYRVRGALRWAM